MPTSQMDGPSACYSQIFRNWTLQTLQKLELEGGILASSAQVVCFSHNDFLISAIQRVPALRAFWEQSYMKFVLVGRRL